MSDAEALEVPARPALETEIPQSPSRIAKLAQGHGWGVETLYARGLGLQQAMTEQITVRFRRSGRIIAATWRNSSDKWAFDNCLELWPMGIGKEPKYLPMNATELKEAVQVPADQYGWEESGEDVKDDRREKIRWELEAMGYSPTGHPIEEINLSRFPDVIDVFNVKENFNPGERVQVLGLVEELSKKKTRKTGKPMAFFGVSDQTGLMPCITFNSNVEVLVNGLLVHAKGELEERDGDLMLKVTTVKEVKWQ